MPRSAYPGILLLFLPLVIFVLACSTEAKPKPSAETERGGPPPGNPTLHSPSQPLSLVEWAPRFCEIAQLLELRTETAGKSLNERYGDPNTLPLEQRKARSLDSTHLLVFAMDDAAANMRLLSAPIGVAAFQAANVRQLEAVAQELVFADVKVQSASDVATVAAANLGVLATAQRTAADVGVTVQEMPAEALAALHAVPRCGSVTG